MSSYFTFTYHVIYSKEDAQNSLIYSYQHGFSGFAALLTSSQAKKISGTQQNSNSHLRNIRIFDSENKVSKPESCK